MIHLLNHGIHVVNWNRGGIFWCNFRHIPQLVFFPPLTVCHFAATALNTPKSVCEQRDLCVRPLLPQMDLKLNHISIPRGSRPCPLCSVLWSRVVAVCCRLKRSPTWKRTEHNCLHLYKTISLNSKATRKTNFTCYIYVALYRAMYRDK